MKLPETIYTARIFGNYVYEWSKEDCLLRKRKQNEDTVARVVSHVSSPDKVDEVIRRDYLKS